MTDRCGNFNFMQLNATMLVLYCNYIATYATIFSNIGEWSNATILQLMQLYCNNFVCNYATMQHATYATSSTLWNLCNFMQLYATYATMQLMQLYVGTILQLMQLYATILQQFCMQLCNYMQLMQLYCNYMQLGVAI
jgi:hypothetical protein